MWWSVYNRWDHREREPAVDARHGCYGCREEVHYSLGVSWWYMNWLQMDAPYWSDGFASIQLNMKLKYGRERARVAWMTRLRAGAPF